MHKGYLKTAAFLGALSVILGAFAAHKLKELFAEKAVEIFRTGVTYMFYHAFALMIVGILYQHFTNKLVKVAGLLFIVGIVLFSGSLFILTYKEGMVKPGFNWAGPITPIGGACFIAGWVCLALGIKK